MDTPKPSPLLSPTTESDKPEILIGSRRKFFIKIYVEEELYLQFNAFEQEHPEHDEHLCNHPRCRDFKKIIQRILDAICQGTGFEALVKWPLPGLHNGYLVDVRQKKEVWVHYGSLTICPRVSGPSWYLSVDDTTGPNGEPGELYEALCKKHRDTKA